MVRAIREPGASCDQTPGRSQRYRRRYEGWTGPECGTAALHSGDAALAIIEGTAFDINLAALPNGVRVFGEPRLVVCDSEPVNLEVILNVGPPVLGSGQVVAISVDRLAVTRWWPQEASPARWSETDVGGRPAALMSPIRELEGVSDAALFVLDADGGGSTRLMGTISTALIQEIAEALYR